MSGRASGRGQLCAHETPHRTGFRPAFSSLAAAPRPPRPPRRRRRRRARGRASRYLRPNTPYEHAVLSSQWKKLVGWSDRWAAARSRTTSGSSSDAVRVCVASGPNSSDLRRRPTAARAGRRCSRTRARTFARSFPRRVHGFAGNLGAGSQRIDHRHDGALRDQGRRRDVESRDQRHGAGRVGHLQPHGDRRDSTSSPWAAPTAPRSCSARATAARRGRRSI